MSVVSMPPSVRNTSPESCGKSLRYFAMSSLRFCRCGGSVTTVVSPLMRPHLQPNAAPQPLPEADARQLGKRKARSFSRFLTLPVENRTCHFDGIRLSTFDSSPWGAHEASVPIAPVPQVSTCVQLARSLDTF